VHRTRIEASLASDGSDDAAFFNFSLASDGTGSRLELNVTSGQGVTMYLYPACDVQYAQTYYCYQGIMCIVPIPNQLNSQTYQTSVPGFQPFPGTRSVRSFDSLKVVVIAHSATSFDINYLIGDDACSPIPTNLTCSNYISGSSFALPDELPGRDTTANALYTTLLAAFDTTASGCATPPLNVAACQNSLRTFTCQLAFDQCSNGNTQTASSSACEDVQNNCGSTFTTIGFNQFDCGHNSLGGLKLVESDAGRVHGLPVIVFFMLAFLFFLA